MLTRAKVKRIVKGEKKSQADYGRRESQAEYEGRKVKLMMRSRAMGIEVRIGYTIGSQMVVASGSNGGVPSGIGRDRRIWTGGK